MATNQTTTPTPRTEVNTVLSYILKGQDGEVVMSTRIAQYLEQNIDRYENFLRQGKVTAVQMQQLRDYIAKHKSATSAASGCVASTSTANGGTTTAATATTATAFESGSPFVTFTPGKSYPVSQTVSAINPGPFHIGGTLTSKRLIPELQGTTQEVAIAKCRHAAELLGKPCITEDTALCFVAYNGLPGPYIKHFMKTLGHQGLNNMLVGFPTKDAYALCTFAYSAGPGTEPILFEGRTDGTIVPARGPGDFGWDAIFQPKGCYKTYAEMTKEEKNIISHRYRALEKLRSYLATLPENSL
ncbi:hypothetical protein AZE42_04171 [Rhizopogon vesiculosus]|uniref:Inosine triphosphate pyrophosphatase n=1 Tax=Rhizopogon vesiculosus TaxID=180088 RepID=A0A1J8QDT4_9AGAM|nr:hypothetical protein AZE42_04171 [Rhizopogon vesiculosus]